VRADGHQVFRRLAHLARSPKQCVFLNLQIGGDGAVFQHGRATQLAPGGATLLDSTAPFELRFPAAMDVISVHIPHDRLDGCADKLLALTASNITAQRACARLLHPYVELLADADAGLSQGELRAAECGLVDLLSALIDSSFDAAACPSSSSRALTRVLRYIAMHHADAALTPARIASGCAMSLRTLHATCAREGRTVMELLRAARLQRAAAALRGSDEPVVNIALAAGFGDLSGFHRLFRRTYGCTPAQYRGTRCAGRDVPDEMCRTRCAGRDVPDVMCRT
jgi:AraC-like DNA-binding protein